MDMQFPASHTIGKVKSSQALNPAESTTLALSSVQTALQWPSSVLCRLRCLSRPAFYVRGQRSRAPHTELPHRSAAVQLLHLHIESTAFSMLRQAGSLLLRLPGTAEVLQQQAGALALAVNSLQGTVSNAAQQGFTTLTGRYVQHLSPHPAAMLAEVKTAVAPVQQCCDLS